MVESSLRRYHLPLSFLFPSSLLSSPFIVSSPFSLSFRPSASIISLSLSVRLLTLTPLCVVDPIKIDEYFEPRTWEEVAEMEDHYDVTKLSNLGSTLSHVKSDFFEHHSELDEDLIKEDEGEVYLCDIALQHLCGTLSSTVSRVALLLLLVTYTHISRFPFFFFALVVSSLALTL